jgi:hypothetical protein
MPEITTMPELDRLSFLLGSWRGEAVDQFGEKGVLTSSSECTRVLDGRFLRWEGETKKDGAILNQSVQFIGYDSARGSYVFKRLWSYGFIENGTGGWQDDQTLMFDITSVDNRPAWFEGMQWRSFIRRYSDSEVGHGLYSSAGGGPFKLYGETRVLKVKA